MLGMCPVKVERMSSNSLSIKEYFIHLDKTPGVVAEMSYPRGGGGGGVESGKQLISSGEKEYMHVTSLWPHQVSVLISPQTE